MVQVSKAIHFFKSFMIWNDTTPLRGSPGNNKAFTLSHTCYACIINTYTQSHGETLDYTDWFFFVHFLKGNMYLWKWFPVSGKKADIWYWLLMDIDCCYVDQWVSKVSWWTCMFKHISNVKQTRHVETFWLIIIIMRNFILYEDWTLKE